MMTHIAVLMTCFNRVEVTLRGLRSLFAAKPVEVEFDVFLVDDASPDGTAARVRTEFPSVRVIDSLGNLFWCKGMRLAWDRAIAEEAQGVARPYDYFLWFNDDVVLKPTAISAMLAQATTNSLVVGKFSSDATEREVSFGLDGASHWMNGNLVLISREVYKSIGPIYGGYRHAYGDHDYGLMAQRAGFAVKLSAEFCGVCPRQPERYLSMQDRSLRDRFRVLFATKGICLHDAVLFRYRNWGVAMAIACFVHLVGKAVIGR